MYRSQRFRLYLTTEQEAYFRQCAGAARYAWNWGLCLCQRYYRRYGKTVSFLRLMRQWNRHKRGKKAWASQVGKVVTATALHRLDAAYADFFAKRIRFPKFKGKRNSPVKFTIADQGCMVRFRERRVKLPVVGLIRYKGERRWPNAKIKSAVVKLESGRWFMSVLFDLPDPQPGLHDGPTCGIDLGCVAFATIASGEKVVDEVKPPKPYKKAERKLRRLQRRLSRRKNGGKNRDKAKCAVSALHWRIVSIRNDFLHKLSRKVVDDYSRVVLEDLNVAGMARGSVRKSIHDLGFYEFRRQVQYKAVVTGARVVLASRFYPSSKTCSSCGLVKTKLGLKERVWTCEGCGVTHDRDHNAAINLEKLGRGTPEVTPAETGGSLKGGNARRGAGRGSRNAKKSTNGFFGEAKTGFPPVVPSTAEVPR